MKTKAIWFVVLGTPFFFLLLWCTQKKSLDLYTTKHVPSASCDSSSASLDIQHALAFILSDGQLGFVYFNRVTSYSGDYVMRFFENPDCSRKSSEVHGTLRMRNFVFWKMPQMPNLSHRGKTLFYWNPPANLFFSENVRKVSIIRREELNLLEGASSNNVEWISVATTPL